MKKKYIFMIIIIILLGVISFFYYEKVHTETFLSLPEAKEVVSIKYKIVINHTKIFVKLCRKQQESMLY